MMLHTDFPPPPEDGLASYSTVPERRRSSPLTLLNHPQDHRVIIFPSAYQVLLRLYLLIQLTLHDALELLYSFALESDEFRFDQFGDILKVDRGISDSSFSLIGISY